MGDEPIQVQKAINFLNSQSTTQLQFVGIQYKADLIAQEKKYLVKDTLAREVELKANFLKTRAEQFKNMFRNLFSQGLPNFWDEEGIMVEENDYLSKLQEKKDYTSSIDMLDPIIKGHHIFEVLDKEFCLFYETRKIIASLPPPSYNLYSYFDVVNRDLLVVAFPSSLVSQRIS